MAANSGLFAKWLVAQDAENYFKKRVPKIKAEPGNKDLSAKQIAEIMLQRAHDKISKDTPAPGSLHEEYRKLWVETKDRLPASDQNNSKIFGKAYQQRLKAYAEAKPLSSRTPAFRAQWELAEQLITSSKTAAQMDRKEGRFEKISEAMPILTRATQLTSEVKAYDEAVKKLEETRANPNDYKRAKVAMQKAATALATKLEKEKIKINAEFQHEKNKLYEQTQLLAAQGKAISKLAGGSVAGAPYKEVPILGAEPGAINIKEDKGYCTLTTRNWNNEKKIFESPKPVVDDQGKPLVPTMEELEAAVKAVNAQRQAEAALPGALPYKEVKLNKSLNPLSKKFKIETKRSDNETDIHNDLDTMRQAIIAEVNKRPTLHSPVTHAPATASGIPVTAAGAPAAVPPAAAVPTGTPTATPKRSP